MYRQSRNYENLNKLIFSGVGQFGIPHIKAESPDLPQGFIGFNFAKSCKVPENKAVHFFVDDYQFSRLWTNPDAYIDVLKRFRFVFSPDFQCIRTSRKPLKSGITTASIGSGRTGRATGSQLFRPYRGVTSPVLTGALMENLTAVRLLFRVSERRLTSEQRVYFLKGITR